MSKIDRSEPAAHAVGSPLHAPVGRPVPERCRDCGLTLAPWLRLYCTRCVLAHIGDD